MTTITAQMVKDLRERTGAGMMECKKALTEADGDIEKAIDILVMFANNVRKSIKEEGNIVYNISTRRLVNMIRAYEIYEDLEIAVKYCIQRYDNHHKEAYMNFLKTLIPYVQQAGKKKKKSASAGSSLINRLRSIPAELGALKNLQTLSLCENRLSSIPKELGALKNLQKLWLSNNKLS